MDLATFEKFLNQLPAAEISTEEPEEPAVRKLNRSIKPNQTLGEIQEKALDCRYGLMAVAMEIEYVPSAILEMLENKELAQWIIDMEAKIQRNFETFREMDGVQQGLTREAALAPENVLAYTPDEPDTTVGMEDLKAAWKLEFPGTEMEDYID